MAQHGMRDAALGELGLTPDASDDDIRRAWRRLARETHPDLHPGDDAAGSKFARAREAYEALATAATGAAAGGRDGEPDGDWLDGCRWMAEAHVIELRRRIFPAFAAHFRGGPSLARGLEDAAKGGFADAPDPSGADRRAPIWARVWAWHTWRRLSLVVEEGWPMGGGLVGLVRRERQLYLVLWPRLLWEGGVRDDDGVRTLLRRAIDAGVVAAAPTLLSLGAPPPPAPVPVPVDRAWWFSQLLWPVLWTGAAVLSGVLLVTAFVAGRAAG